MAKRISRKGIKYCLFDDDACVIGLVKNDMDNLYIPDEVEGLPVTSIAMHALMHKNFETISLPASISAIGNAGIYGCFNLREIEFRGNNPTKIKLDICAIGYCDRLTTIKGNRTLHQGWRNSIEHCPNLILTNNIA